MPNLYVKNPKIHIHKKKHNKPLGNIYPSCESIKFIPSTMSLYKTPLMNKSLNSKNLRKLDPTDAFCCRNIKVT